MLQLDDSMVLYTQQHDFLASKDLAGGEEVISLPVSAIGGPGAKASFTGKKGALDLIRQCPPVQDCGFIIASAMSDLEYDVPDSLSIRKRLANPNAQDTTSQLNHKLLFDLAIWEEAFLYISRGKNKRVDALYHLAATQMKVDPSEDKIGRFSYTYDDEVLNRDDVIHFRASPTHPSYKLSKIGSLQNIIRAVINLNQRIERETGRKIDSIINFKSMKEYTPKERDAHKQGLDEAAESKSGLSTVFSGGGSDVQILDLTKVATPDLQSFYFGLIGLIAAKWRIPPFMIGGPSAERYNNLSQRYLSLFRDTLSPLATTVSQTYSKAFGVEVRLNVDKLRRGDFLMMLNAAIAATGGPVMKLNEVRPGYLDLEPIDEPWADQIRDAPATQAVDPGRPRGDERDESNPRPSDEEQNG